MSVELPVDIELRSRVDAFRKLARPWSIAELRVTESEYNQLQEWYKLYPKKSTNNSDIWLVLILMVEIYRRADEEVIRICLEHSPDAKSAIVNQVNLFSDKIWFLLYMALADLNWECTKLLFHAGNPAQCAALCVVNGGKDLRFQNDIHVSPDKQIMDAIKNSLFDINTAGSVTGSLVNLRHVNEHEGHYQANYIKLQAGLRDRDIPELQGWIKGYNQPIHIGCLTKGEVNEQEPFKEMASESFQDLWGILGEFVDGDIDENELRNYLCASEWLLPKWEDSIVTELSKERPSLRMQQPGDKDNQHKTRYKAQSDFNNFVGRPRLQVYNGRLRFQIEVKIASLITHPAVRACPDNQKLRVVCSERAIEYTKKQSEYLPDRSPVLTLLADTRPSVFVTVEDGAGNVLVVEPVTLFDFENGPCVYLEDGYRIDDINKLRKGYPYIAVWWSDWGWRCEELTGQSKPYTYCRFTVDDEPITIYSPDGEIYCELNAQESNEDIRGCIKFDRTNDGFILAVSNGDTLKSVRIDGDEHSVEEGITSFVWDQAYMMVKVQVPICVRFIHNNHIYNMSPIDRSNPFLNPCSFMAYLDKTVWQPTWTKIKHDERYEIDVGVYNPGVIYWPGAQHQSSLEDTVLLEQDIVVGYVDRFGKVEFQAGIDRRGHGSSIYTKDKDGQISQLPFISVSHGVISPNTMLTTETGKALILQLAHDIPGNKYITVKIWDRRLGVRSYDGKLQTIQQEHFVRVDEYVGRPWCVILLCGGNAIGWASDPGWTWCFQNGMAPEELIPLLIEFEVPVCDINTHEYIHGYYCRNRKQLMTMASSKTNENWMCKYIEQICRQPQEPIPPVKNAPKEAEPLPLVYSPDGIITFIDDIPVRYQKLICDIRQICYTSGPILAIRSIIRNKTPIDSLIYVGERYISQALRKIQQMNGELRYIECQLIACRDHLKLPAISTKLGLSDNDLQDLLRQMVRSSKLDYPDTMALNTGFMNKATILPMDQFVRLMDYILLRMIIKVFE